MARYMERITTRSEHLRAFASDLRAMADDFDRQADFMDELKIDTVEATHWKTVRDAVAGFAAFLGAIKKAIVELKMMSTIQSMLIRQPSIADDQAEVLEIHEQRKQKSQDKPKRKPTS